MPKDNKKSHINDIDSLSKKSKEAHYIPSFKLKGSNLLNRPHPKGYAEEWIESLKKVPPEETFQIKSILVFRLNNEWLALPTASVKDVTETCPIHSLPHRSNDILLGITNVQGELSIAISMKALLGVSGTSTSKASLSHRIYPRSIVFGYDKDDFVFAVDEVYGIHLLHPEDLEAVPANVGKSLANYATGIFSFNEKRVGLLDENLLIESTKENYL